MPVCRAVVIIARRATTISYSTPRVDIARLGALLRFPGARLVPKILARKAPCAEPDREGECLGCCRRSWVGEALKFV